MCRLQPGCGRPGGFWVRLCSKLRAAWRAREGGRKRGSLRTSCDCCPCLQPGDGAVAEDELQDNKKLKVGAVWSLPARALRGLGGQPQTRGTAVLMLGILGWAPAWHAPGTAARLSQERSGLLCQGLSTPGGLGGGASLGDGLSLLALPLAHWVSWGLGFCTLGTTGLEELTSSFTTPPCHDQSKA